ncbi:MAG: hypothetical protein R3C10_08495 [Pirellulales bacterium]
MASRRWARMIKAGVIASQNDYHNINQALELIEQNRVNGELSAQNKAIKARILAAMPDQKSRVDSIALYEELFRTNKPSAKQRLLLARLYELTGQWSKCREQMIAAMADAPNDRDLIATYVEMSLRHREFSDVSLFIDRLAKVAPNWDYVTAARGKLLVKQGNVVKGVEIIKSLVPKSITVSNVVSVREVAQLLAELQQYDEAEKLYRDYVAQKPDETRALANFLAISPNGDIHEVLELSEKDLDVSVPRRAEAIANALTALRNHRVDIQPADYELVESWITKSLNDDPNSIAYTLQLAELHDIQGHYDEAEANYRTVINTEGVTDTQLAIAENNLAYLLSLSGRNVDEALERIEDAILRLGPLPQLLDTRGMVYLALKQPENARRDFSAAVTEDAGAMTYYHLALSEQAMGDRRAAARSFESAKSHGFVDTNLSRLERSQYDQLMQGISEG